MMTVSLIKSSFQALDAPGAGSGRETHRVGQVEVADPVVALQELEDPAVGAVQFHGGALRKDKLRSLPEKI